MFTVISSLKILLLKKKAITLLSSSWIMLLRKKLSGRKSLTARGRLCGSPGYMDYALECADYEGMLCTYSPATDVHALGYMANEDFSLIGAIH